MVATQNRRNLGVWDGEFRGLDQGVTGRDKHRHETNLAIKELYGHECYVQEDSTSIANVARQWGRPMTTFAFVKEIRKLNPALICDTVANAVGTSLQINEVKNGKRVAIAYGEPVIMPEYCVMSVKETKAPEPTMDRRVAFMETRRTPHQVMFRGWRALLVLLVNTKHIRLTDAERIARKYGTEDRESWAVKTGRLGGRTI